MKSDWADKKAKELLLTPIATYNIGREQGERYIEAVAQALREVAEHDELYRMGYEAGIVYERSTRHSHIARTTPVAGT